VGLAESEGRADIGREANLEIGNREIENREIGGNGGAMGERAAMGWKRGIF
jgi:hypothetical protein